MSKVFRIKREKYETTEIHHRRHREKEFQERLIL
jgi:hypothetical protein